MTFDKEFKKALTLMPEKEKDKLILRLLKHNLELANRLRFELVDADSVEEKREVIENQVIKNLERATINFYSPGYLLLDARETSGLINQHVSITKDKYGEISLNCLMLRELLARNNEKISSASLSKSHTFCIYIISRIYKIFILIQKQHEDLHIEFADDIAAIGGYIINNPHLMKTAINNGLDIGWLIQFDIPKDISEIHKNLRKDGFLR